MKTTNKLRVVLFSLTLLLMLLMLVVIFIGSNGLFSTNTKAAASKQKINCNQMYAISRVGNGCLPGEKQVSGNGTVLMDLWDTTGHVVGYQWVPNGHCCLPILPTSIPAPKKTGNGSSGKNTGTRNPKVKTY